jgi:hypothetical protein
LDRKFFSWMYPSFPMHAPPRLNATTHFVSSFRPTTSQFAINVGLAPF